MLFNGSKGSFLLHLSWGDPNESRWSSVVNWCDDTRDAVAWLLSSVSAPSLRPPMSVLWWRWCDLALHLSLTRSTSAAPLTPKNSETPWLMLRVKRFTHLSVASLLAWLLSSTDLRNATPYEQTRVQWSIIALILTYDAKPYDRQGNPILEEKPSV